MQPRKIYRGNPQRDYRRNKKTLERIFTHYMPNWQKDTAKLISLYGIPLSTIYEWRQHFKKDGNWRPWKSNMNQQKRSFSNAVEDALFDFIRDNFIDTCQLFTNATFKEYALSAFAQEDNENKEFHCSKGFINNFKKRHNISSRKARLKRRPNVSAEEQDRWKDTITNLLNNVDHSRIINVDETFCNRFPNTMKTWAISKQEGVHININGDVKEGITALASITAAREKLPLFFIAKGKSVRCENSQLGNVGSNYSTHSSTGWTTIKTFSEYLKFLRKVFNDENELHLILDSFSVHKSQTINDLAENLKIKLYFVPSGLTDLYQPLDRYVFGALKSKWKRKISLEELNKISKKRAVALMIESWNEISTAVIDKAWRIYES